MLSFNGDKIYIPKDGDRIHYWGYENQILTLLIDAIYIKITYETEPPFGDFIYSMSISNKDETYAFPLWFFGRNIYYYKDFLIVEAWDEKPYSGQLNSVLVDLYKCRFSKLDNWYRKIEVNNNEISFINDAFDHQIDIPHVAISLINNWILF